MSIKASLTYYTNTLWEGALQKYRYRGGYDLLWRIPIAKRSEAFLPLRGVQSFQLVLPVWSRTMSSLPQQSHFFVVTPYPITITMATGLPPCLDFGTFVAHRGVVLRLNVR